MKFLKKHFQNKFNNVQTLDVLQHLKTYKKTGFVHTDDLLSYWYIAFLFVPIVYKETIDEILCAF